MSDARDEVAATRRSYDKGAARYVDGIGTVIGPATETPQDQSILARFGDPVAGEAGIRRIGDEGCGLGRANVDRHIGATNQVDGDVATRPP